MKPSFVVHKNGTESADKKSTGNFHSGVDRGHSSFFYASNLLMEIEMYFFTTDT